MSYTYDNLYQLKSATGKYRPDRGYGYDYTSTFQYDETANLWGGTPPSAWGSIT